MKYLTYSLLFFILLSGCNSSEKKEAMETKNNVHSVIAKDVIHVNDYSYILAQENGKELWLAAPITQINIGDTYYFDSYMEMKAFESKELNRTFESIYFIEGIRTTADKKAAVSNINANTHQATKPEIKKEAIEIKSEANTITVAELFKNKNTYNNKIVRIKGKVVKFNPAIMETNWVHIQDGTEFEGAFDITITTKSDVQINDIVTLEGKVTLNKDFGAGYIYDVIIENATLIK